MLDYVVFSLSELLNQYDEGEIENKLREFKCEKEADLEDFLHYKACAYEKSETGKTFLFVDKQLLEVGEFSIMGFFTNGLTSYDLSEMSKKKRKKVLGSMPGRDNLKSFPAFLIGQLGRSDKYNSEQLPGYKLLHECYIQLKEVSKIVGGEHVILECRECMYSNFYSKQGFKKLNNELDENGLYTLYNRIKFKELLNEEKEIN
ncbi:hypothetical protein ACX35A_000898 [Enterococcus faecalis]|uniref:hypothetical protein n=1 Tax=Enterococcus faecalis TaxID=1351 RepID=UPI000DE833B0|nr:hypothetical protein [Enterococcus faecalis]EGO5841604.1 hypothetical protein [Enterococcus faecalis]EGO6036311.1 hypothetical protein [Enterococcus faecalis]EGO8095148.1 hypothetical protein [Enterococcus faecalis]EHS7937538.1 hypothetical protein [Enterococcus faecalis]EHY9171066.1 hypothetical protein [Enterococcus faecalis]